DGYAGQNFEFNPFINSTTSRTQTISVKEGSRLKSEGVGRASQLTARKSRQKARDCKAELDPAPLSPALKFVPRRTPGDHDATVASDYQCRRLIVLALR